MSNNSLNRLGEDACYKQAKDYSNGQILKFQTTNHLDLLNAHKDFNHFTMSATESHGKVTGDRVDTYSKLANAQHTNEKYKGSFGMLPLNPAFKGNTVQDTDTESSIRNLQNPRKNSCLPRESEFYNKSFYIFSNENVPRPEKAVEANRVGLSSRFSCRSG